METKKDRLIKEQKVQAWLDQLDRLSQEAAQGSVESFADLVITIVPPADEGSPEFEVRELAGLVETRTFATIYASKKFIGDLWYNSGPDATGFPRDFIPTVQEIGQRLGEFIQAGIFNPDGDGNDPLEKFGQATEAFYRLIHETEERAKVEDGSDWVKL